jgi:hypothetical protein
MKPTWFLPVPTEPPAETGIAEDGLLNMYPADEYTEVRFERK